ncbi:MAG: hypothetical protein HZB46_01905 [Solirubrobacterales bacterium]|nr:hypothetical protein [Solirubrobacterales bacterium]
MQLRRLAATAAVALVAAFGLAACGAEEDVRLGETEGVYVKAGEVKYQVQISRPLNPTDWEDRDYLLGLPAGEQLAGDESYFAVFIRAFNQTDAPHPSATQFEIEDTTGAKFEPLQLDTKANAFVFQPGTVPAGLQLPLPNSAGQTNTTQGGLLLFKLPTAALENRPLELHIAAPEGGEGAIVDLDV